MHQSISAAPAPSPPPLGYCGAFVRLVSHGGGALANFALPGGRAFANPGAKPELLTRTRFPISIELHRGFQWKKQADWLICQGRGKIEEVCKGMFSILCMHFFIAYASQNYIAELGSYRRESTFFWLLNQVSLDIIRRTSFHIYKTIHSSKLYSALLILMSIIL